MIQVANHNQNTNQEGGGQKRIASHHVKRAPLGDISNQIPISKHAKNVAIKPGPNCKVVKPAIKSVVQEPDPATTNKANDEPAVVPMELDDVVDLEIDEVLVVLYL